MPSVIVVGCQWGDEGKGKIVDYLSAQADYVVRYQGGSNAGTHDKSWRPDLSPETPTLRSNT